MVKIIRPSQKVSHRLVGGTIIHALAHYGQFLIDVIPLLPLDEVREYFQSKFIIHAFSYLNNKEKGFFHEIHRDQRFYSGDVPIMLNMIVMLDDFTEENGATWIFPFDWKEKPTDLDFYFHATQCTGKAGDIILFDGNTWHRSGENKTGKDRRCFAITFTKSCMKQLIDYPKILGDIKQSEEIKQLLGYHSRVPESLQEWEGPRTYFKDQD